MRYKIKDITNKKNIKTTITDVFLFQENLFLPHLTSGSKRNAVSNARIIGIEIGKIKVINKIANKINKMMINNFFVIHLGIYNTSF